MTIEQYSWSPFPEALAEALRNHQNDRLGRINYSAFFRDVKSDYSYEYLRLMAVGDRPVRPDAIESIAKALGMSPHYFLEYRQWWLGHQATQDPELLKQLYDLARAWLEPGHAEQQEGQASAADGPGRLKGRIRRKTIKEGFQGHQPVPQG